MSVQVRSMTEAVRIREMLLRRGISVKVIQTPQAFRSGGCGYSLLIRPESLSELERAAEQIGIRILSIERQNP